MPRRLSAEVRLKPCFASGSSNSVSNPVVFPRLKLSLIHIFDDLGIYQGELRSIFLSDSFVKKGVVRKESYPVVKESKFVCVSTFNRSADFTVYALSLMLKVCLLYTSRCV